MRGKKRAQRFDAAGLRLAAGDPENVVETGQRLRRGIGIGRFEIVDERGRVPRRPTSSIRWASPGKDRKPGLDGRRFETERQRRGGGAGGVLGVVQAAQRADAAEFGDHAAPAPSARMIRWPST